MIDWAFFITPALYRLSKVGNSRPTYMTGNPHDAGEVISVLSRGTVVPSRNENVSTLSITAL